MEFFKYTRTFNFMGKSKIAMVFSIILVLASYALLATKGLNYGIDFSGGTLVQVKYNQAAPIDKIRDVVTVDMAFFDLSMLSLFYPLYRDKHNLSSRVFCSPPNTTFLGFLLSSSACF